MPKSHEPFYSNNGKRQILIAEDEMINREILGNMLEREYDILYACDGAEAMEMIRANRETLSLILLDIMMPVMTGIEVLKKVRDDQTLSHIPIIVATAERDTEIESLNLGAIDFVSKPYPAEGVVSARVLHAIELTEDRDIIKSTERDDLTDLYNKEYFYRYAEQFDQYHKDLGMDAIVVDVNHFHMINERYGKDYGDEVLRKIGQQVQEMVEDAGGIVCRKDADTFMVYCPHREDYKEILENASIFLAGEESAENRIRLRMGVYMNVDKTLDIERRFDRAKLASDQVRGNMIENLGIYDSTLHNNQIEQEQLIEAFPAAIADGQFQVYYQPKFDIRPDTPLLISAEALVRWNHPEKGLISPGKFIPLFEENGLIQRLDHYVWRETARQIRQWRKELGYAVPVSVNASRVDIYDHHVTDTLQSILDDYEITGHDLLLEVTESAYTQDANKIIETVEKIREMGFRVEMDDFGTGYSSLNMISNLPIDAMKLDMLFIRDAFREGGDDQMLQVIISIAKYLKVPVIAEGVETEDQLHALKKLGCDIVQGYFFSKPVPASEFEAFILQRKEVEYAEEERRRAEQEAADAARIRTAEEAAAQKAAEDKDELPADETEVYMGRGLEEKFPLKKRSASGFLTDQEGAGCEEDDGRGCSGIQLKTVSIFFVIIALFAAVALMVADVSVTNGYQRMENASDRYIAAQSAASDMESGSDYLTDRVRCFVVTGEVEYLRDFYEEVDNTRRRDHAVENLEFLLGGSDTEALSSLNKALSLSNELIEIENYAMRLMVETGDYSSKDVPEEISRLTINAEDRNLTSDQMRHKAQNMVFDNNYMHYKERIRENIGLCTQALIRLSSIELNEASAKLSVLVHIQTGLSIAFLMIVLGMVLIITNMIRTPLTNMVKRMQKQEVIEPTGVEELRFVTRTYNKILRENEEAREKLSHEASHDVLTGLLNRGAYELLMEETDKEHMALILIDVDCFKQVNDNYGHAVGDRVLKRVAEILRKSFRSVDILCRIGGDEFAVVMTRADSSMRDLVKKKIAEANKQLQRPKDDLPPVSLSVGVAFSDRENPQGDIFRDADTALYRVKKAGRKGCEIY